MRAVSLAFAILPLLGACSSETEGSNSSSGSGGAGAGSVSSTASTSVGGAGGEGTGGQVSSEASSGSGGSQDCFTCGNAECDQELAACNQDAKCSAWVDCATPCFQQNLGPSCWSDCNAKFPDAAPGYDPIYACLCQHCSAPTACGDSVDPCNQ